MWTRYPKCEGFVGELVLLRYRSRCRKTRVRGRVAEQPDGAQASRRIGFRAARRVALEGEKGDGVTFLSFFGPPHDSATWKLLTMAMMREFKRALRP